MAELMHQGYQGEPIAAVHVYVPVILEYEDGGWFLHWRFGGVIHSEQINATTQREAALEATRLTMEGLVRGGLPKNPGTEGG